MGLFLELLDLREDVSKKSGHRSRNSKTKLMGLMGTEYKGRTPNVQLRIAGSWPTLEYLLTVISGNDFSILEL